MARRKPLAKTTMGESETADSLISLFEAVEDPRVDRTKGYSLAEILFLVLSAVISGVNHLTEIEKFGQAKIEWLRKFLPYENGVPSHDTIGRVLGLVEPDALERMFLLWMESAASQVNGVIAVDGKTLRGAIERGNSHSFVHMVSAFASTNGVVLGQVKTNEKSNEITAIPVLLETLHLKGNTVTIDAMGCQSRITRQIVKRGGEFYIAVKENQPTLYADVVSAFEEVDLSGTNGFQSQYETSESKPKHGRQERRGCQTLNAEGLLEHSEKWRDVKSLVRVVSHRAGSNASVEDADGSVRYYISSAENPSAKDALGCTRAHWSVENNLHWTLDVAFREDACRIYAGNAAENLVVVRHIALNMLRSVKGVKGSIPSRRNQAAWTDDVRERILCARPD